VRRVVILLAWFAFLAGWVQNLAAVVRTTDADPVTDIFIARVVGIVLFPIGGVLGWV
jgi:hypothetical protein